MRTVATVTPTNHLWAFGKAALLGLILLLGPIAYSATVSVEPSDELVALGTSVSVNVAIQGLGPGGPPSLGTFDFNLGFDPSVLAFDSIAFGDPVLGDQLGPVFGSITGFSNDPVTGLVNQFEVSLELPATLDTLQPASFILTHLTFASVGLGTTSLIVSDLILGDALGDPLVASPIANGSVTVGPTTVPDSSQSLSLLGLSLAALCACRFHGRDANIA